MDHDPLPTPNKAAALGRGVESVAADRGDRRLVQALAAGRAHDLRVVRQAVHTDPEPDLNGPDVAPTPAARGAGRGGSLADRGGGNSCRNGGGLGFGLRGLGHRRGRRGRWWCGRGGRCVGLCRLWNGSDGVCCAVGRRLAAAAAGGGPRRRWLFQWERRGGRRHYDRLGDLERGGLGPGDERLGLGRNAMVLDREPRRSAVDLEDADHDPSQDEQGEAVQSERAEPSRVADLGRRSRGAQSFACGRHRATLRDERAPRLRHQTVLLLEPC